MWNGTMFVDLDRPLNASSLLSASAELLVVLVLQVWCSCMKHGLVTLVVIMLLNDTETFQVLFIVSLYCAWNITTVEINIGVHLAYLKVKPA